MPPVTKKVLGWLVRLALFPLLSAWTLIRLWVAFGDAYPLEPLLTAALLISAAVLIIEAVGKLTQRILLPWTTWWKNLLSLVPPLLLGWFFDISFSMLTTAPPAVEWLPWDLEILCHLGNAVVFAAIVMAL